MSLLIDFITNQNFSSFEQLKKFFVKKEVAVKETVKLYMLCFTEQSDISDPMIRECNGVIFEKETNILVHYTFSKCYDSQNENDNGDIYHGNGDTTDEINWFIDGSVVKLFYYDNKWNIATSRNIEGFKNSWSSKKSFEELFKECILQSNFIDYDDFLDTLDINCSYSYIIQHPEHITAVKVGVPLAISLNKIYNKTLIEELPETNNFTVYKTVEEIVNKKNRGVNENYIIYKIDKDGKVCDRVKMLSPAFVSLKKLFGNYPNIGLRYLEVLHDDIQLNDLISSYTCYAYTFEEIEHKLTDACKKIHYIYIETHVKKTHIEYDNKYSRTIYQLHACYKRTKQPITGIDVYYKLEEIGKINPRVLANIIGFRY